MANALRGRYCDHSTPASAELVRNAIMMDATISANFDRNWTYPGAQNAINVTKTWNRSAAGLSGTSIKAEFGPSSSSPATVDYGALHSKAGFKPSRISEPKLKTRGVSKPCALYRYFLQFAWGWTEVAPSQ